MLPQPHLQLAGVTGLQVSWRWVFSRPAGCFPDGMSRAGEPLEAVVVLAQSPEREWGGGENTGSETRRPTDGRAEDVRDTDRQEKNPESGRRESSRRGWLENGQSR